MDAAEDAQLLALLESKMDRPSIARKLKTDRLSHKRATEGSEGHRRDGHLNSLFLTSRRLHPREIHPAKADWESDVPNKEQKTATDLEEMIIMEFRKHPELNNILSVIVTPEIFRPGGLTWNVTVLPMVWQRGRIWPTRSYEGFRISSIFLREWQTATEILIKPQRAATS